MKKPLLECCVDCVESALAAKKGGADRLELCANLIIGGTTPDINLYHRIREQCDILINVLIRPRFGDFCYTDEEFEIIRRDVKMFREAGADGVVIGILKPDGSLDVERMKILMEEAGPLSVTLHRAFDVCADPMQALQQAKELGIDTILTSGQKNTAIEGSQLLQELVKAANGDVDILLPHVRQNHAGQPYDLPQRGRQHGPADDERIHHLADQRRRDCQGAQGSGPGRSITPILPIRQFTLIRRTSYVL